ncbi:hypothetical protein V6N11_058539 [Hibiscus sabdariffa]|uniref:Uncharacterized protein n=1 Tax=Hibiscus sabdariffa TaxID=183260 RepID=A0ABR2U5B7_9ROSI
MKVACRPPAPPLSAPPMLPLNVSNSAPVRFLTEEHVRLYNEEFYDRDLCWKQGFGLPSVDDPIQEDLAQPLLHDAKISFTSNDKHDNKEEDEEDVQGDVVLIVNEENEEEKEVNCKDEYNVFEANTEILEDLDIVQIIKDEINQHDEEQSFEKGNVQKDKEATLQLLDLNDDKVARDAATADEHDLDAENIISNVVEDMLKEAKVSLPEKSIVTQVGSDEGKLSEIMVHTPKPTPMEKVVAAAFVTPIPSIAMATATKKSTNKKKMSIKAKMIAKKICPSLTSLRKSP